MKEKLIVYWARRDFRFRDNPALLYAVEKSKKEALPFLPIFILEDYMREGGTRFQWGYPQRYFVSHALPQFFSHFEKSVVATGKGAQTLITLSEVYDIEVYVNEDVYPDFYKQIKKLQKNNVAVHLFRDQLTVSKDTVSGKGTHYSIFTPFKKAVWESFVQEKEIAEADLSHIVYADIQKREALIATLPCTTDAILGAHSNEKKIEVGGRAYDLTLLVTEPASYSQWCFSEKEALQHFDGYLKKHLDTYKKDRDSLEKNLTSKMSLALTWGLVSARTLVSRIKKHFNDDFSNLFSTASSEGAVHYISELIWREFYKYLFFHTPTLMNTEFQERFRGRIGWVDTETAHMRFTAWIQGRTGYDIVDAAMIELARTGWMHNRARMIVASVLTKNLGVDWRWGQEYFRAMLIDLDEGSNNGGWQWGASVGADPKPIRIFNPYLQADNYDETAVYRKKWLSRPLDSVIPLIEHKHARSEALKRYGLSSEGGIRDY